MIIVLIFAFQSAAHSRDSVKYGLLVTALQNPVTLGNRLEIEKLVKFAKENSIDTIFIQIYRANISYFPSKVGDSAPYRTCLKSVGEDGLAFLIKKAHASGIKVYAWLNMMSLGENRNAVILKKYGPSILTCGPSGKKLIEDYKTDDQYFMEPGDLRVRRELVNMTEEIVSTYASLDGLLFDYIRYPDKDPPYGYTASNMARFKKAYGRKYIDEKDPDWKNWKRRQVTQTLEAVVKRAKCIRPDIEISATACAPYIRAYHEAFQDWPLWLKERIVDYVTLMSYPPDVRSLKIYVGEAKEKNTDLRGVNIAISAYKLINLPEIFAQQLKFCAGAKPNMCIIFHYESLLKNRALAKVMSESKF